MLDFMMAVMSRSIAHRLMVKNPNMSATIDIMDSICLVHIICPFLESYQQEKDDLEAILIISMEGMIRRRHLLSEHLYPNINESTVLLDLFFDTIFIEADTILAARNS